MRKPSELIWTSPGSSKPKPQHGKWKRGRFNETGLIPKQVNMISQLEARGNRRMVAITVANLVTKWESAGRNILRCAKMENVWYPKTRKPTNRHTFMRTSTIIITQLYFMRCHIRAYQISPRAKDSSIKTLRCKDTRPTRIDLKEPQNGFSRGFSQTSNHQGSCSFT